MKTTKNATLSISTGRLEINTIQHEVPQYVGDRANISSPNNGWAVEFYDPMEFRMSAYRWEAQLSHNGKAVASKSLSSFVKAGLHRPYPFQPWSTNSKLSISLWTGQQHLLSPETDKSTRCDPEGLIMGISWSPTIPRCVLATDKALQVMDEEGKIIRVLGEYPQHGYTSTWIGWVPNSQEFYVLHGLPQWGERNVLRIFDESGNQKAQYTLNPNILFPYNAEEYRDLDQNRFNLIIGKGTRTTASQLHQWNNVKSGNDGLYLSIQRPTSHAVGPKNEAMANAEELWLSLRLIP